VTFLFDVFVKAFERPEDNRWEARRRAKGAASIDAAAYMSARQTQKGAGAKKGKAAAPARRDGCNVIKTKSFASFS